MERERWSGKPAPVLRVAWDLSRLLSVSERTADGRPTQSRHRHAGEQRDSARQRAELGHADTSVLCPQSLCRAGAKPRHFALERRGLRQTAANVDLGRIDGPPERTVFATVECAATAARFWRSGSLACSGRRRRRPRRVDRRAAQACAGTLRTGTRALEVLFEGADVGTEPDHPAPMPFAAACRSQRRCTPIRSWQIA